MDDMEYFRARVENQRKLNETLWAIAEASEATSRRFYWAMAVMFVVGLGVLVYAFTAPGEHPIAVGVGVFFTMAGPLWSMIWANGMNQ
jgi:uncharacterized membrane protein YgaE (UPF0421/DUF939 family)